MNSNRPRFALFGNVYQTKKNQYVAAIIRKLQAMEVQICVEEEFGDLSNENWGWT